MHDCLLVPYLGLFGSVLSNGDKSMIPSSLWQLHGSILTQVRKQETVFQSQVPMRQKHRTLIIFMFTIQTHNRTTYLWGSTGLVYKQNHGCTAVLSTHLYSSWSVLSYLFLLDADPKSCTKSCHKTLKCISNSVVIRKTINIALPHQFTCMHNNLGMFRVTWMTCRGQS